jgi:hypothetical protein
MATTDASPASDEGVDWGHLRSASVLDSLLDHVPKRTLCTLVPIAPHVTFFVHRRWRVIHRQKRPLTLLLPSWRSIDSSAPWIRFKTTALLHLGIIVFCSPAGDFLRALFTYADHLDGRPSAPNVALHPGIAADAADRGMLGFLQWTLRYGCSLDGRVCQFAAFGEHLHILRWALQNDCPRDVWSCRNAARLALFSTLIWLRQNRFPWDEHTTAEAAGNGHLHVLQWARQNGCPWNIRTCNSAAERGHLHILQWAHEGSLDTWPCSDEPCDWARAHRADATPE